MARIEAKTQEIVVGITLNLSNDDATHLHYVLNNCYGDAYGPRTDKKWKETWPWLKKFVEELNEKRGEGCTMGARVKNGNRNPTRGAGAPE